MRYVTITSKNNFTKLEIKGVCVSHYLKCNGFVEYSMSVFLTWCFSDGLKVWNESLITQFNTAWVWEILDVTSNLLIFHCEQSSLSLFELYLCV